MGGATEDDCAVVKLAGAGGGETWRHVIAGGYTTIYLYDNVASLAADAGNDVVAAGWLADTPTTIDFTVVKLAASDGHELWRKQLNPNADQLNAAYAVGVDGSGDVLAAGLL